MSECWLPALATECEMQSSIVRAAALLVGFSVFNCGSSSTVLDPGADAGSGGSSDQTQNGSGSYPAGSGGTAAGAGSDSAGSGGAAAGPGGAAGVGGLSENGGSSGAGSDPGVPRCGDGQRTPTELCDDGNTDDSDGCSSTCQPEYCGDGIKQAGEACDPADLQGVPCTRDCVACPRWYRDADQDGRGDPNTSVLSCFEVPGYVDTGDDCDDTSDRVSYLDADKDGYGDASVPQQACASTTVVNNDDDCNDADANVHPGQTKWFAAADSRGSFDYDCNTIAERRYPSLMPGCGNGWSGFVPSCGENGQYYTGSATGSGCNMSSSIVKQTCR